MRRLDVWYARLDVDQIEQLLRDQVKGGPGQALPQERGQGPVEGQHEGVQQAGRDGRRTPAPDRRSAA